MSQQHTKNNFLWTSKSNQPQCTLFVSAQAKMDCKSESWWLQKMWNSLRPPIWTKLPILTLILLLVKSNLHLTCTSWAQIQTYLGYMCWQHSWHPLRLPQPYKGWDTFSYGDRPTLLNEKKGMLVLKCHLFILLSVTLLSWYQRTWAWGWSLIYQGALSFTIYRASSHGLTLYPFELAGLGLTWPSSYLEIESTGLEVIYTLLTLLKGGVPLVFWVGNNGVQGW